MEDRVSRERWDERYAAEEAVWNPGPNALLVAELEDLAPGRALDLACGRGRNSVWLAGKGWLVTGVDFSAEGLAKARRLAADRAVEVTWVEADVVTWQLRRASFELVLVTYLHVPGEERSQVLARAQSALAPGGLLLVIGHDSSNLLHGSGGPQDPAVLWGPEEVVDQLAGLRIERAARVTRTVLTETGEATAIDAFVRAVRPC
jgi:SAM-dependent methyltransferase